MVLKRRVKKIEDKLKTKNSDIKFWVLWNDIDEQKQIEDIESGKTKSVCGSYYSPNDRNYFISEDFVPASALKNIREN
jgi:hypothetical protein